MTKPSTTQIDRSQHLRGLIPAAFTPMNPDGSLALGAIDAYAEFLLREHLAGVFVCGTTGESLSLTTQERMQVAERWQSAACGRLPVIVHVGHTSLEDAKALARHAQKIGAHSISALAPCFFKPGLKELVEFCARVAASAPELPFFYYHMPSMTGVNVAVADFINQAADRIPTFAGIKFTFEDLMDLQNCHRVSAGRFNLMFGRDEILLAGLTTGCTSAVGSTYNFVADGFNRILAAFQAGELATAQTLQRQAAEMITVIVKFGGIPAMKEMMKMAGMNCGPVRLPLRSLTAQDVTQLGLALRALGNSPFVDFACGEPSNRVVASQRA